MKNSLISLSVVFVFLAPQVSAESLFDKIKRKADEIIAEQEAKADQKIDQTIDETVESVGQTIDEKAGSTTSQSDAGAPSPSDFNQNVTLVRTAQNDLKRLGYAVTVDGLYGPGTRNAILAFEADTGRPLTGNVSPQLINALSITRSVNASEKAVAPANSYAQKDATSDTHLSDERPVGENASQATSIPNNTPPNSQSSNSVISQFPRDLATIPLVLVLNKYDPSSIDDDRLLRNVKGQIQSDRSGYRGAVPQNYVFFFEEHELSDRPLDFLAEDLMPIVKQRLSQYSEEIPSRVTFVWPLTKGGFKYSNGKLRYGQTDQEVDFLQKFYEPDINKQLLPQLGRSFIIPYPNVDFPDFWKDFPYRPYANLVIRSGGSGQTHLSADRVLTFPALSVNRELAEELWNGPDCSYGDNYTEAIMNDPEEAARIQEGVNECRKLDEKFRRQTLKLVYHLELHDVVVALNKPIVTATLLKADVVDWRGEIIASLPATVFPLAEDLAQKQAKETLAAQKEMQDKASALQTMREHLSTADVIGLTLGMPFDEADQLVRKNVNVSVITKRESKDYAPNDFFSEVLGFYTEDEAEKVFIFEDSRDSNKLVAVTRFVRLPPGLKRDTSHPSGMPETLRTKLIDKYGEPNSSRSGMEWDTSDGESTYCILSYGRTYDQTIQSDDSREAITLQPMVAIYNEDQKNDAYKDMIKTCGPMLHARIWGDGLLVTLYDFAAFARAHITKDRESKDFDLKL